MNCKYCNTELVRYINGESYGFGASYPYESGFYCSKRCGSWSDLQIVRGEHLVDYNKKLKEQEELENFMKTPKDITNDSLEKKANTLTLHFIGFIPKPIGISDEAYEKCLEAFNNNRGQFEWEMEAILGVLKGA